VDSSDADDEGSSSEARSLLLRIPVVRLRSLLLTFMMRVLAVRRLLMTFLMSSPAVRSLLLRLSMRGVLAMRSQTIILLNSIILLRKHHL